MTVVLTTPDIINGIILTLLVTLSIYHLFVFFSRGYLEGKYYLHFSMLNISLAVFVLFSSNLREYLFTSTDLNNTVGGLISGISFVAFMISSKNILPIMASFREKSHKMFAPFFATLVIFLTLNCTVFFLPFEFYMRKLYPIISVVAAISAVYLFIITIHRLLQRKLLFQPINGLLLLSTLLLLVELIAQRVIRVIATNDQPFNGVFVITGMASLLWAYILTLRFNEEHKELKTIKGNLEDRIKHRTTQLEEALAQKNSVFINIAHEIKTPITLINNYFSAFMKQQNPNKELDVINRNIQKLNRDVQNFFDTEKYRKGQPLYDNKQTTNLSELLTNLLPLYKSWTESRNLGYTYHVEDNVFIQVDPAAMERVVSNLVENAIKYSGNDTEINVSLHKNNEQLMLIVEDNGTGIPLHLHNKIFDPYFQIATEKQNTQGMGMGLSIVKRIVDELKGDIKLESCEANGTRFIITLKQHHTSANELLSAYNPKIKQTIPEVYTLKDEVSNKYFPSILLIEDNHDMLLGMQDQLKSSYNVYVACNGIEALDKLNSMSPPNIIISDVMMDGMNGYELLEILSEQEHLCHIPFLFISAKGSIAEKLKGVQLGAVDYLPKPFDMDELKAKIASILHMVNKRQHAVLNNAFEYISNEIDRDDKVQTTNGPILELNLKKYDLTAREKEVVMQLRHEINNKEIASHLAISERTISKHIQNIYAKVRVNNKTDLLEKFN